MRARSAPVGAGAVPVCDLGECVACTITSLSHFSTMSRGTPGSARATKRVDTATPSSSRRVDGVEGMPTQAGTRRDGAQKDDGIAK